MHKCCHHFIISFYMQYRVYCKQSDFIQSFVKSYMQKKLIQQYYSRMNTPTLWNKCKKIIFLVLCSKGVSEITLHNKCIILFMEWDLYVSILVKIFNIQWDALNLGKCVPCKCSEIEDCNMNDLWHLEFCELFDCVKW